MPQETFGAVNPNPPEEGMASLPRRSFVALAALGATLALVGCETTGQARATGTSTSTPKPAPPVKQPPRLATAEAGPMPGVIGRTKWSKGQAVVSLMNPMVPVRWITIHHDGMTKFVATDERSSASRLELIRNGHRGKGWGDIGYHFAIDRSGRVWEGRALKWQGAHVKDHNEGNIGILVMGNFDLQSPSSLQLKALERQVQAIMLKYKIPASRVRTHKEWEGAKTACPGVSLQSHMKTWRARGIKV